MSERANDPPAAGGGADGHRRRAKHFYPQRHRKNRCPQKFEPRREMIEPARFGPREKRERNNAHRFLGVVGAVAMRHPGCAHDLRLSEKLMDKVRSKDRKSTRLNSSH